MLYITSLQGLFHQRYKKKWIETLLGLTKIKVRSINSTVNKKSQVCQNKGFIDVGLNKYIHL